MCLTQLINSKTKTSHGSDDIPIKVVKDVIDHILHALTHIINLSLMNGVVPDQLKIAEVILI